MTQDLKLVAIIIVTLSLMFATTLLLDLKLVQDLLVRQIIIYTAILIQFLIGFLVFKHNLTPKT